jgi:hypothetical protein
MFKSDLVVGVIVGVRVTEVSENDQLQRHQHDLQELNHQFPGCLKEIFCNQIFSLSIVETTKFLVWKFENVQCLEITFETQCF